METIEVIKKKKYEMEKVNLTRSVEREIIEEILADCNLNILEKIVMRLFYKAFVKFYHQIRIKFINNF